MQLVADLFDKYMPGFVRIMLKTYGSIWRLLLKLFNIHPWNNYWEYISFALTFLVLIAPVGIVIVFMTITAIRIYQRYAPCAVRNKCRFEPSCSEHVIMSIQKYGLLQGVVKGGERLKRCNINSGGFDYP